MTASCPNWSELVAMREVSGEDPPAWRTSLAHMESCSHCRQEALLADPTLLFQRLARPATGARAAGPPSGRHSADIDAVRQGVAALREASRLGETVSGRSASEPKPAFPRRGWWQTAAAAALLAVGLSLSPAVPVDRTPKTPPAVEQVQASDEWEGDLPWTPTSRGLTTEPVTAEIGMPLIDDLDLPDPRVYQIAEEGVQVVMVFDESLEIDL